MYLFSFLKSPALKISILFFILIIAMAANAQVVRQPLSLKYAGLGAYSKKFVDAFSATANQASLAQLKTGAFGVYGERRFMVEELNGYSTIIAMPTTSGTFGFQGDYFGSSAYNESQLGLIYARKVTAQVDVGAKFNYHSVRVQGYGNASAVNFEAGAVFHLTERFHTGIHVYNPTSSRLGKTGNEKLASIYRFGAGYEASDKVFASAEIVKLEDQQLSVNAGFQYNLYEKVFLRAGIATGTNNSYAGIGYQFSTARLDVSASYHPQLGFTPGILLLINFKKAAQQ